MTKKQTPDKDKMVARTIAPASYKFSQSPSLIYFITGEEDGETVLSETKQVDDRHYRVLWTRRQAKSEDPKLLKAIDWRFSRLDAGGRDEDPPYLSFYFLIYAVLVQNNAFPQKTSKDAFAKSAISFLRGKEEFVPWVTHWDNIATGRPGTYKASVHLETQKIGQVPLGRQLTLWDLWGGEDLKETSKQIKIETLGLRGLTLTQYKVIETVQKIMSMTDYKGNRPGEMRQTEKFSGYIPAIEFTPAQFCEIYGVTKCKTKNGKWRFQGRERDEVLKQLQTLPETSFAFAFTRRSWDDKGKESIERIHTPSARVWTYNEHYRGLTKEENEALNQAGENAKKKKPGAKIYKIYLTNLCPIFIDQIDSHFILKPSEYPALNGCGSKYPYLFFTWLGIEASNRRAKNITNWAIDVDRKALAYRLELIHLIKSRQWARIDKIIFDCYEKAKAEGILSAVEINHKGVTKIYDILTLNIKYFEKIGWKMPPKT